jgi:hypothetical protein
VTLDQYLAGAPDLAAACAKEIPRAEIDARIAKLAPVRAHSHGARVALAFLERVVKEAK